MTKSLTVRADATLDCQGLACPMPIIKTKKAIEQLRAGQVVEIQATDKGSLADLQGWTKNTGHHYLGTIHEGNVLKHYVRKAVANEMKEEIKFPQSIENEELQKRLDANEDCIVLDVREPAEFAFNHIPAAVSIPLGELAERMHELNDGQPIYVICRTGNRSDMACRLLAENGFGQVSNVVPGMSGWEGATDAAV